MSDAPESYVVAYRTAVLAEAAWQPTRAGGVSSRDRS